MNDLKLKIKDIYRYTVTIILGLSIVFLVWSIISGYGFIKEAIVLISASSIYLLIISLKRIDNTIDIENPYKFLKVISPHILNDILFFSLLSCSIFLLTFSKIYFLPLSFFILCIAIGGILVIDILSTNGIIRTRIILIKIFLFSLFLRFASLYKFPNMTNDPVYHEYIVEGIVREGYNFLPDNALYSDYLGMHLPVVATKVVTGLSVKNAMMIIPFFEVLGLLFLFLITKKIFNTKIALISIFLIGIGYHHMRWGFSIIPMSLGLTLFILLIYLIIRSLTSRNSIIFSAFTFIIMLILVFTHTLVPLIFLIFLISMNLGIGFHSLIFKERSLLRNLKISLSFLFGIIMFSYWMFCTGFFLELTNIIKYVLTADSLKLTATISMEIAQIDYHSMLLDISFILFLIPVVIGTFYCLIHKRDFYSKMLIYGGFGLMFILYITQYTRLYTDAILPDRWWGFIFITIAPICALGIFLLYTAIRNNLVKTIVTVLIIIALLSINLMTAVVAPDNPIFNTKRHNSFNDGEVVAVNSFLNYDDGKVVSDMTYNDYIQYAIGNEIEDVYNYIRLGDLSNINDTILIRDWILNYPINVEFTGKAGGYSGRDIYLDDAQKKIIIKLEDQYNMVYDNGEVVTYLNYK